MPETEMLRSIQDALIESTIPQRAVTQAGGFIVMLSPDDPMIWINYAVPTAPPTSDDVDAMVTVFEAANRTPRLEFFADLWPAVPGLLEEKGFTCEKRMPIMILPRDEVRGDLSHRLTTKAAVADDVPVLRQVLGEAFGEMDSSPEDGTRTAIESDRYLAAISYLDGEPAAAGFAVGTGKIREIAGIGTRPDFRRKGAAGAVISELLARFFEAGGELAWLTPGDDGAQALYERLGFRTVAWQVCYQRD